MAATHGPTRFTPHPSGGPRQQLDSAAATPAHLLRATRFPYAGRRPAAARCPTCRAPSPCLLQPDPPPLDSAAALPARFPFPTTPDSDPPLRRLVNPPPSRCSPPAGRTRKSPSSPASRHTPLAAGGGATSLLFAHSPVRRPRCSDAAPVVWRARLFAEHCCGLPLRRGCVESPLVR